MTLPRPALGVYLIAGWPDVSTYRDVVRRLEGVIDFFEMGIPTKNPKYDGPFIRRAHGEITTADFSRPRVPTYLMAYWEDYQTHLFKIASEIGARGVLFPDLLIDFPNALEEYVEMSKRHGLSTVFFIPGKFPYRLARALVDLEPDFIYLGLYAATGIELPVYVERNIKILKSIAPDVYVVAGFAVDTPKKVEMLIRAGADAVVVGTAFMKKLAAGFGDALDFLQSLKKALT